jgi:hypothetical protein
MRNHAQKRVGMTSIWRFLVDPTGGCTAYYRSMVIVQSQVEVTETSFYLREGRYRTKLFSQPLACTVYRASRNVSDHTLDPRAIKPASAKRISAHLSEEVVEVVFSLLSRSGRAELVVFVWSLTEETKDKHAMLTDDHGVASQLTFHKTDKPFRAGTSSRTTHKAWSLCAV